MRGDSLRCVHVPSSIEQIQSRLDSKAETSLVLLYHMELSHRKQWGRTMEGLYYRTQSGGRRSRLAGACYLDTWTKLRARARSPGGGGVPEEESDRTPGCLAEAYTGSGSNRSGRS